MGAHFASLHLPLYLLQDLARVQPQLISASQQLSRACAGRPVAASLLLQLTQNQKQLTSTSSLDGSLRAVGTVHSAVVLRLHKESSAAAAAFLDANSSGGALMQPAGASKVLKLGDDCMKRLRNGDIYRVSEQPRVLCGVHVHARSRGITSRV
jgi:hypothetical protein